MSLNTSIKFGTDGWRAIIAEDFTFANVARVAQATADYWNSVTIPNTEKMAVVGFDRRFLSDQFAQLTAEVLAGNGFEVILTSIPSPTQAVSFAVKTHRAIGGVMITASHNPPAFNGFKLKAWYGGSADPSICQAVEALVDKSPVKTLPLSDGLKTKRIRVRDLHPVYFKAIKKLVNFPLIAKSRIKLAHDPLFGVGAGCYENLLANTTCRVTTLNANHDPNFGGINPEPVARNYAGTQAYLSKHPHDLCVVTDGDADRVGGMDGRGNALSTHQIICLLIQHFVKNRGAKGRVIKALTTTSMVDKMCAHYGLPLVETGVGFKYICTEMLKGDVMLGFEESGGIGFPGHIPERDGILSGLMLLELLAVEKKPLTKLLQALTQQFGPYCYARIDTRFAVEKRSALMEFCKNNPPSKLIKSPLVEIKSHDGVKYIAADGSWLMLRGSGTEPILRIYAESKSDADAARLLRTGLALTKLG